MLTSEGRGADLMGMSPQRRRGMDIKQMKNFVSQELKGLKQEHRLLSLRRFQLEGRAKGSLQRRSGRRSLFMWKIVLFFGLKWEEVLLHFALRGPYSSGQ